MSIFKNETLNELDKLVPAQMGKVKQVLLFTLIDIHLEGKTTDQEFSQSMKAFLGVEE